jgi:D-sedoheptulose 7-phosphate isomerase
MPDKMEMSLATRTAKFAALLERCEITGRDGNAFEQEPGVLAAMRMLAQVRDSRGSVYVIGNGGSAAIASHAANDLVNVAKLRASTLHDSSLLTCMANDYGYENAFSRLLAQMARPGDVLIAISSSGRSMNIRNAAAQMADNGGTVMTLSGFARDNPLRALGDVNIWLDSGDYGLVEVGHQFVLHNISDRFGAGFGN